MIIFSIYFPTALHSFATVILSLGLKALRDVPMNLLSLQGICDGTHPEQGALWEESSVLWLQTKRPGLPVWEPLRTVE